MKLTFKKLDEIFPEANSIEIDESLPNAPSGIIIHVIQ